jgi:hypothetical protein
MAILVDPNARTVTEVPYNGDIKQFTFYTCGEHIDAAPFMNAGNGGHLDEDGYWEEGQSAVPGLTFSDSFLCDSDAMVCDDCAFFKTPFHCHPVAGKTLIVGVDENGKSASPEVTVEQVREHIEWLGYELI